MTDEYKIIFPPDILGGYHSRQQEDSRLLSLSKSLPLFLFLSSPPSSFHSVVLPASTGFTFILLISVSQLVFLPLFLLYAAPFIHIFVSLALLYVETTHVKVWNVAASEENYNCRCHFMHLTATKLPKLLISDLLIGPIWPLMPALWPVTANEGFPGEDSSCDASCGQWKFKPVNTSLKFLRVLVLLHVCCGNSNMWRCIGL